MSPERRNEIQQVFIRVCRDSGFQLEPARAAHLAAAVLGIHAMTVWHTMDLATMERIASGKHPAAKRSGSAQ